MPDPLATITTRATPQNQPATAGQTRNNAGGYTFTIDDTARLRRFLTLGVAGGTFYVGEQKLTKDNADVVVRQARANATALVDLVVEISVAGRAPKPNPALFALAAAAGLGDVDGRRAAFTALPRVARTGTHLMTFAGYMEQFRGWGPLARRGIGNGWYCLPDVEKVAYQAVKYRSRGGWTHRDLLRLAHPGTDEPARRALFNWATQGNVTTSRAPDSADRAVGATRADLPLIVHAFEAAQAATTVQQWTALIAEHPLSWEMLPDAALAEPAVWEALIDRGMPQTALMRQLPRLTRLGVLGRMSPRTAAVAAQLADPERLRSGRVHPINVLVAARTYASGHGARGAGEWTPVREIVDALDAAFYAAYGAIEPAGKRTLLALDVSGSMTAPVAGMPLTCREASAALALVTAATEPTTATVAFTSGSSWGRRSLNTDFGISELAISPRQRLDDVIKTVSNLPWGGTDCAAPMVWALAKNIKVDTFCVFTDNETWHGNVHPHQALERYRERMGIPARLIVLAMTPTNFSIADPKDPGMLDIAGLDTAVPNLIADFSRGDL